ncbi:hypothetical protein [Undibacterium sp. TC9W]|uniref:hypothetical protein n=1 Tax=Undibacterium sp. TC9W TaxID=3413053 RepID=UPI003BF02EA4
MRKIKKLMYWSSAAIFALTMYVWNYGLWPVHFDINWDEEVRLHNGKIVIVHIKRIYARQGLRLERWSGIQSAMEFSFDTGTPMGKFNHQFNRGRLVFLDQADGKWYIGYSESQINNSTDIGKLSMYPHVAILDASGILTKPSGWDEIPSSITDLNIMPPTPNSEGIAQFNNQLLTLEEKLNHWNKYPTGPGEYRITRITEQVRNEK